MSNAPLAIRKVKAAKRLTPRTAFPSLPPVETTDTQAHPLAGLPSPTWPDISTTLIPEKAVKRSSRSRITRTHGLVAILVCMSQVAAKQAPAWGLSMVVHMVTLVTMAIVVAPNARRTKHSSMSSLRRPNSSGSKRSRISPTAAGDVG